VIHQAASGRQQQMGGGGERERESRARESFCLSQIGRGSEEEKEKINVLLCKFVGAGPTEEFM
jgi:hypothetical protein